MVLESGYHESADAWALTETEPPVPAESVMAGIARFTRVCAYDRPGTLRLTGDQPAVTDRSTPVPMPRTAADVVADLHAVLVAAGELPPFVLVAHSLGGLFALLYAQTHPGEVAGLVLVDPFTAEVPAIFGSRWAGYRQLLAAPVVPDPSSESIDIDTSAAQAAAAPPLPQVPAAVISKTEPFAGVPAELPGGLTAADLERLWPEVQDSAVRLVPGTVHVFATGSDHYVQVRQPDLVVAVTRLITGRTGTG